MCKLLLCRPVAALPQPAEPQHQHQPQAQGGPGQAPGLQQQQQQRSMQPAYLPYLPHLTAAPGPQQQQQQPRQAMLPHQHPDPIGDQDSDAIIQALLAVKTAANKVVQLQVSTLMDSCCMHGCWGS